MPALKCTMPALKCTMPALKCTDASRAGFAAGMGEVFE